MSRAKKTKKTKSSYRGKDRRTTFRKQATFQADIFRVNEMSFKKKWDHEVGVNIGMRGMCLRSTKRLPEKANVTIAILLHNENSALVEVDAKLVWTHQRKENRQSLYYMGLEFTRLDAEVRQKIERFVNEGRP